MRVDFHKHFLKMLGRLPGGVEQKFYERLDMFEQNPNQPLLKNHSVEKAYPDWWSINITGDYRALYEPINADFVVFMKIGTHSQLYG